MMYRVCVGLVLIAALAGCASQAPAPDYQALVASTDRSDADRVNVVVYYSSMQVTPASSAPPNEAGRALYQRVCFRCHGDQARGSERFPRLAGQQHTYLVKSLTRYRDRTGTRMEPEMLAMTAALKDADIKAVADFLSSMR